MATTTLQREHEHDPLQMMSSKRLSALLDVPVQTVYQWRKSGDGPVAHRYGRGLYWRRADVEAWLGATREA